MTPSPAGAAPRMASPPPPSGTFKAVSAGLLHLRHLPGDTVACWGAKYYGQSSPPSGTFKAISAGGYHACGIRNG